MTLEWLNQDDVYVCERGMIYKGHEGQLFETEGSPYMERAARANVRDNCIV